MNKINALIVEIQSALTELAELINEEPEAETIPVRRYIQHIHTGEWMVDGLLSAQWPIEWSVKQDRTCYTHKYVELKKLLLDKGYVVGQDVRIMRAKR